MSLIQRGSMAILGGVSGIAIMAIWMSSMVVGCVKAPSSPGAVACDGPCVDLMSSTSHCGAAGDCDGATASADCLGASDGTVCGAQALCTGGVCVNNDARLSALAISSGTLSPVFASDTTMYAVSIPTLTTSVQVTPTSSGAGATITVNGATMASGETSTPIAVGPAGMATVTIQVTALGGATKSYTVVVTRDGIHYLKASNTNAGDQFGGTVALSGDTLVVGLPRRLLRFRSWSRAAGKHARGRRLL